MKTKIAIADDHTIVRDGIRLMCLTDDALELVFESATVNGFVKLMEKNPFDVAVIDIQFPDGSGIDLAKTILLKFPDARLLVFSGMMDEETILKAISTGVSGYVSKDASMAELRIAISTVASFEQFFSMSVGQILYKSYVKKQQQGLSENIPDAVLSDRETEVLKGFAEGLSYKEIAEKLFISPRTVETHKENIMKKLGLHSLADMIRYAIKEEIISL
ncbi:MAG: response regulator transcription factor [Bacteroidales bacterium]|jgi:DNA-binding NarL/FixJ family response regulator|nr:response regulator transcription factor [Bacteroidales bacterium]